MIIIVSTAATNTGGTLTIYQQFINHLANHVDGNSYYIFVDPSMPQPVIAGVTYLHDKNHSWIHRILWDGLYLKRWLKRTAISPDLIVSFQNTGTSCRVPHLIYYQHLVPISPNKWSFFKADERLFFLYKNVYPYFVQKYLRNDTKVVVQIPFIRDLFLKRFRLPKENVFTLKPDLEKIEVNTNYCGNLNTNHYHFVYPATPWIYKGHLMLVEALVALQRKNKDLVSKIRIHLTLTDKSHQKLNKAIYEARFHDQFIFEGQMEHEKLLTLYSLMNGLLFPSTMESLGLPLLEAASFGLPIIASDLPYAHNVIDEYEGVTFVTANNQNHWADAIERVCKSNRHYNPLKINTEQSSWNTFFDLISTFSRGSAKE